MGVAFETMKNGTDTKRRTHNFEHDAQREPLQLDRIVA
jgi:hypothetical protein